MAGKVLSGNRCKVYVTKDDGSSVLVGIFNRMSYQVSLAAEPAFILGRDSAASIDYTGYEIVSISATGWRVVGQGAHRLAGVPKLQELLTAGYLTFEVFDRGTGESVARISNVRAVGYSGDFASKSLSEMPVNYIGIKAADEDGPQDEEGTAADLP